MRGSLRCLLGVAALGVACSASSCGPGGRADSGAGAEALGFAGNQLQLAPGVQLSSFTNSISGSGGFSKSGTVDLGASTALSVLVGSLPAGAGYTVGLDATSTDGSTHCAGSAPFSITAHATTAVVVHT